MSARPMPIVVEAFRAVARQPLVALGFLTGAVLLGVPVYFGDQWLGIDPKAEVLPLWYGVYSSAQDLLLVVGSTALQTWCFTLIGRDMDRPLWKCESLRDGFQRFFIIWLLINLISVALSHAQVTAAKAEVVDLVALFETIILVGMVVLPIIGACLMYLGGLAWDRMGDALAPVVRYPSLTLQAVLFHVLAYLLRGVIIFSPIIPEAHASLVLCLLMAPFALLDLLGFAAMWRVCIHHRDHGHQLESDPYDF